MVNDQNPYATPKNVQCESATRSRHPMLWSGVVLFIVGVLIVSIDPAFASDSVMWAGFITSYVGLAVMLIFGIRWIRHDRAQT
jgi:uncharacterized membrane protein HdeD (DUF308 family)